MIWHFTKMQGCGNDFLIFDQMRARSNTPITSQMAAQLCHRQFGLGADGLVVLSPGRAAEARWDFYNCDGSEAEMCGNAARCVMRLLEERYFPGRALINLETKAGVIQGRKLDDNLVEIYLADNGTGPIDYEEKILRIDEQNYRLYCLNTGVPHAVFEVEDIFKYPIDSLGKKLVRHPVFPKGTNVTFFQKSGAQAILSTTFERGVEKETYACGTGVAAAALVFAQLYSQSFPINVRVPGGKIEVDMHPLNQSIQLRGNAEYVAEMEIENLAHDFIPPKLFSEGAL